MTEENGDASGHSNQEVVEADRPKPSFRARLTIWLIAGVALAGIALMCIVILALIALRS